MITQTELRSLWKHDEEQDLLVWNVKTTHRNIGDPVNLSQRSQRIGNNRYKTKSLLSIFYHGSAGNTKVSNPIAHSELLAVLDYSPETGIFTWKENRGSSAKIGTQAGCIQSEEHPYTIITIGGQQYYGHRLAWFYVYRDWPSDVIDHIDQNPRNNSITNLRDVGYRENRLNSKLSKRSTTGYTGIIEVYNKFRAEYTYYGETFYLGTYSTVESAASARDTFIKEHGL